MALFLMRRLASLIVVVLLVTLFSFALISFIPGDPVITMLGFFDPKKIGALRHKLGYDRPFIVQYFDWLKGFFHGNFGQIFHGPTGSSPAYDAIKRALPISLELMAFAMILTVLIAIPLGVLAAYRAGTWVDKIISTSAFGLIAIPDFALGIILLNVVAAQHQWLPSSFTYFGANHVQHFKSLILPAVALAVGQISGYLRLLRSDMIQTLQEDYVAMARAKGMPDRRVLWRHALRPSSLTLLTVAGLNIGALVGGTVVIEVIFQIPGMGTEIFNAITAQQYQEIQSLVAVIAIGYVFVNLVIDLLYTVLDPRVRSARALA
jgi:peptide/nickel transport system permease protein